MQNNVYGGTRTAAYFDDGTTDIADMNTLDGEMFPESALVGLRETAQISDNAETTLLLSELFTNPDVSDPTTADFSLLLTGDTWIQTWGKSTATPDCGSVEKPQTCGGIWTWSDPDWVWQHGVTDDLNDVTRTEPVSVGAIEKD